jgi:hypothetical protein
MRWTDLSTISWRPIRSDSYNRAQGQIERVFVTPSFSPAPLIGKVALSERIGHCARICARLSLNQLTLRLLEPT